MVGLLRHSQVLILVSAALVGVAAAYGAIGFRALIHAAEDFFWQGNATTVESLMALPWYAKLLVPALGGLLLGPIVYWLAPESRGSGLSEIIESVAVKGGTIRHRVAPAKALASAICIGSGGSVGREAPIIQIGAGIGSSIAQWLRVPTRDMRTLVGCGAAGGLAATFNTPIAGAFFAIEVIIGDYGAAKLSPIIIASVIATVISRSYIDEFPHITAPPFSEDVTLMSLMPFFLVGIACGVFAVLFIRSLSHGAGLAKQVNVPVYLKPAIGGLLVGAIGIFIPHVFGVGYETTNLVLADEFGIDVTKATEVLLLLLILGAKLLATVASLASGGSGGVLAPSLFMGALVGSIVGILTEIVFPGVIGSPTAYALVGMGAMIAAVHHAPISSVLMVFELTNNPVTILPLLVACIPAVVVAAELGRESIDEMNLRLKGVKLRDRTELDVLKGMRVTEAMGDRIATVDPGTPLTTLVERFLASPHPIMWMGKDKKVAGVIESRNLEIAMLERESLLTLIVAQDVSSPAPPPIHPDDDLSFAMKLFGQTDGDVLPVVDRHTGQLAGDLMRSDVIEAYSRELEHRDYVGRAVDVIHLADRAQQVEIGSGYSIIEYHTPTRLAGKTLLELELRSRFGALAILLRRGGESLVPGAETTLEAHDILVLAGQADALARLQKDL